MDTEFAPQWRSSRGADAFAPHALGKKLSAVRVLSGLVGSWLWLFSGAAVADTEQRSAATPQSEAHQSRYSDEELTTLASRWGLLSEPERDAVIAQTRGRMGRHNHYSPTDVRSARRLLSPRELSSLGVASREGLGNQILADLPQLVAHMRALSQRHRDSVASNKRSAAGQSSPAGQGQYRIEIQRRYGRKIVRPDGRVVREVETRVVQVTQRDPSRAFGRMGFERRHQNQPAQSVLGDDQLRENAESAHPNVLQVADPTP